MIEFQCDYGINNPKRINENEIYWIKKGKGNERDLEEVGEIRIIATTLGLKVSEVLKVRSDLKQVVHHFCELVAAFGLNLTVGLGKLTKIGLK